MITAIIWLVALNIILGACWWAEYQHRKALQRLDMNVKRGINDASKLMQAGRQGEGVRQAISYVREWALADGPALTAFQNDTRN
jgi:hypothetical protein